MTPTVTTATPIVGLDLGKYKTVACLYDPAVPDQARFVTLTTCRDELRKLFARCQPGVVVLEACLLAGWVRDFCQELGLVCQVANTASEAWKFKHTKRKTDKDDARRLAELQALGQLPTVNLPPKPTRERRALIAGRQKAVGRRTALMNRIRALLVAQGLPAPRDAAAWTQAGLAGIGLFARPLAECAPEDLWRGLLAEALEELTQACQRQARLEKRLDQLAAADPATQLLQTVPGVGPRTAETIAAHLHEPQRFQNGRQVSAYAGLVPTQYQSGETDRRGRITRRGPAVLRKLLVECAWVMLRYNGWARSVYARLTRGGTTRKKPAIVALARRLLVRCWAMLRDGTPWRDDPSPQVA